MEDKKKDGFHIHTKQFIIKGDRRKSETSQKHKQRVDMVTQDNQSLTLSVPEESVIYPDVGLETVTMTMLGFFRCFDVRIAFQRFCGFKKTNTMFVTTKTSKRWTGSLKLDCAGCSVTVSIVELLPCNHPSAQKKSGAEG